MAVALGSSAPIAVAVVGYGYGGRTMHVPLIDATKGLDMRLVVTSDPAKVAADFAEMQTVNDIEDALQDPGIELVVIVTPNDSHASLAERALRAGKHVVVDKPFTIRSEDGRKLVGLAEECGRMLSVYQSRRWEADYLALSQVIDSGALGEVIYFESHLDRYRPNVRDRWRERAEPGAGIWYDLGSHLIDQALQLFGRPDEISADIQAQRAGASADDYFHAILFYGERRVVLHSTCLAVAGGQRFVVHGTKGSFVKHGRDPQEEALQAQTRPGSPGWGRDPYPGLLTLADGSGAHHVEGPPGDYREFYARVRDTIRCDAPNPVPAGEAVAVIEVIEAGLASAANKSRVCIA